MAMAKITRHGLTTIAILVVALWSCLLAERSLVRKAQIDTARSARAMELLKLRREIRPAVAPAPRPLTAPSRQVVG